jgi:hypothetical protein
MDGRVKPGHDEHDGCETSGGLPVSEPLTFKVDMLSQTLRVHPFPSSPTEKPA